MNLDRGGNEIAVNDLVMVPLRDFLPGKGGFSTMAIGTILRIQRGKFWYSFGKDTGWQDIATVHTKFETVQVRCNRLVLLGSWDNEHTLD